MHDAEHIGMLVLKCIIKSAHITQLGLEASSVSLPVFGLLACTVMDLHLLQVALLLHNLGRVPVVLPCLIS